MTVATASRSSFAGRLAGSKEDTTSTISPRISTSCRRLPSSLEPAVPEELALDGQSLATLLKDATARLDDRTLFVHSQRVDVPIKWRGSAVMTERWRLINGEELYDIKADPDQSTDAAVLNPEVVEHLRSSYDDWWTSLSPVFDDLVRIVVGTEVENPVELTSHDWRTDDEADIAWAARHVYAGHAGNGYWALDVARGGRFRVELRRWPRHMGLWDGGREGEASHRERREGSSAFPLRHGSRF